MTADEIWQLVLKELRKNPRKVYFLDRPFFQRHGVEPFEWMKMATPDLEVEGVPGFDIWLVRLKSFWDISTFHEDLPVRRGLSPLWPHPASVKDFDLPTSGDHRSREAQPSSSTLPPLRGGSSSEGLALARSRRRARKENQLWLKVGVSRGTFACERCCSIFVPPDRHYETIVDESDVWGEYLAINLLAIPPDSDNNVIIELPRDTFTTGTRLLVPYEWLQANSFWEKADEAEVEVPGPMGI